MNRLILKYKYPITFAILAILAWVTYRYFLQGGSQLISFIVVAIIVWVLGTCIFLYLWPSMTYSAYKRAVIVHGLGGAPIPINTLYAVPTLSSPSASNASLLATGTDNILYVGGVLDLSKGPQILHVPDMAGRYYSIQFTDPSKGTNFAYIGKRTTGTQAGDYLIIGPHRQGTISQPMPQIASPHNSALVIGRIFVENNNDLPTAYALASQIHLTPLTH